MALASTRSRQRINIHRRTSESSLDAPTIPHLLHYIYLDGLPAFMTENRTDVDFTLLRSLLEGCQKQHLHWDSIFWDATMARDFIQREYNSLLDFWEAYPSWAQKTDALKVFLLHHYGGVVLDLDIECFRPLDDSLQQYDVMLQGSGNEGFNNGMMASAPGHKFWLDYMEVLKERGPHPIPRDLTKSSAKYMSGTGALTHTVLNYIPSPKPLAGYPGGMVEYEGTVKLWPLGEWLQPCYGEDHLCINQLQSEETRGLWDMSNLYGRHYFLESCPQKSPQLELEHVHVS